MAPTFETRNIGLFDASGANGLTRLQSSAARVVARRRIKFRKWFFKPANVLGMIIGLGAIGTVWMTQYLADPVWGNELADWGVLFGVMVSAMTAAVATATSPPAA